MKPRPETETARTWTAETIQPRKPSPLRSLVPGVYAPWAAVTLGLGVLLVALPLYLLEAGLSFTATSVLV